MRKPTRASSIESQVLEQHASQRTTPSGLRIKDVKAKGQNAETLQARFDEIVREAELKLLGATIDSLRSEVTDCKATIAECPADIDGTIAKWQSMLLSSCPDITREIRKLTEAVAAFIESYSLDCAVSRASKTLQSKIVRMEKVKRVEEMEAVDKFTPSEATIREIICSEVQQSTP